MPTIFKSLEESKDGNVEFDTVVGKLSEEGTITSLVYVPDNVDLQGDNANAEVIKQIAYDFLKEGEGIDINHSFKTLSKEDAYVVESFIVQKGDPRFTDFKDVEGNAVDAEGAWAVVVKIESEELRKLYREGKWAGVSMGGRANYELIQKEEDETSLIKSLLKILKINSGQDAQEEEPEETMKDEDIEKIAKTVATSVGEVLKQNGKGQGDEQDPEPNAVKFEGDPTNAADVKKHQDKLLKAKALKSVDWSDPEAVGKYLAGLGEPATKSDDDNGGNAELEEAKKSLEESQARVDELIAKSNQNPGAGKGKEVEKSEEDDAADRMCKMQEEINGE